MAEIQYRTYPTMPEFRHQFRPADWPADVDYHEVFQLEDSGKWFAVMVSAEGGSQRTSSKDSKQEAEAAIYEHVAFIRSFWDQKIEWMNNNDKTTPDPRRKSKGGEQVVRVDGQHYVVGHTPSAQELESNRQYGGLGHGGREFKIRLHDGREIITRNLWAQGKIPAEYREVLPDNAVFIS